MGERKRNMLERALEEYEENERRALERFNGEIKPLLGVGVQELQNDSTFKAIETLSQEIVSLIGIQEGLAKAKKLETTFNIPYPWLGSIDQMVYLNGERVDRSNLFAFTPQGWLGRSPRDWKLHPIAGAALDCLSYIDSRLRGDWGIDGAVGTEERWAYRDYEDNYSRKPDGLKLWFQKDLRVSFSYREARGSKTYQFCVIYIPHSLGTSWVEICFNHKDIEIISGKATPGGLKKFVLDVARAIRDDKAYLAIPEKETDTLPRGSGYGYGVIPTIETNIALGRIVEELRITRGERRDSIT